MQKMIVLIENIPTTIKIHYVNNKKNLITDSNATTISPAGIRSTPK